MSAKRLSILLTAALSALLVCAPVSFAAGSPALLQGYAWEDHVDIFLSGGLRTDDTQFEVSKQMAEVVDGGLLADKGVTIRTTILLDISTSMPEVMRPKVIDYIDYCIENLNANEQLRIITFGNETVVLQDFTSDRYDLSKASDKIEFNGQQSMIYDATYNSIPELQPVDGDACLYRTIVITDGVDISSTGITKEELYLKLQQSTYPVEVVAVSINGESAAEKELSALTRISGGRYVNFNSETNLEQALLGVGNIVWLRAKLPPALLDGSTRQFNISDGTSSLQFDLKVPVYNGPSPAESGAPSSSEAVHTEPVSEGEPTPGVPAPTPQDAEGGNGVLPIIVIAAAAAAVIAIAAVVIARKKKQPKAASGEKKEAAPAAAGSSETVVLSGGTAARIRKIDDPDKVWEVQLSESVLVGRDESCQIWIDESSVSRQQCVLYMADDGAAMIENKSKANITQVNRVKLDSPQALNEGDQIKCGRVVLVVDSIQKESNGTSGKINKITQFVNV